MANPLWIIGVDALDPDLVRRWVAAGHLPTLGRCIEQGVFGPLCSTYNQITTSAWATVATGANPGVHGIYDFQERVPGQYRLCLPNSASRKLPAFWDTAGEAGRQLILARVPMSFPVQPLNGLAVADWLAPSPNSLGFAYPQQLAPRLVRRFGYAFWGDQVGDQTVHGEKQQRQLLRSLLFRVDRSFELFDYLLARQQADLLFAYLNDADVAGHMFWACHDTTSPLHDPDTPADLQDALLSVYRRVDRALGRLLDAHCYRGNLMIISDHGMGPRNLGPTCVAGLLEAAGLMVCCPPATPHNGLVQHLKTAVSRHVPWHIRRRLKPIDPTTRANGFTDQLLSHLDFSRSRAFSYVSLQTGEIWLNLRSRDPEGIVEPGAEADQLIRYITRLFLQARDPVTGLRPVEEVKRREEIFSGDHMDVIPDLHVRFREGVRVHGLSTTLDNGTRITVRPPDQNGSPYSGLHRLYGTIIACGPDLVAADEVVQADLMDIAPTALALLDTAIPSYIEGRVLDEILHDNVLPRYRDLTLPPAAQSNGPVYTDQERAQVEKRLRSLGYM